MIFQVIHEISLGFAVFLSCGFSNHPPFGGWNPRSSSPTLGPVVLQDFDLQKSPRQRHVQHHLRYGMWRTGHLASHAQVCLGPRER